MNKILINFNKNYSISNKGEIYSIRQNKILKQKIDKYGYKVIILRDEQVKKHNIFIHRLVAIYFISNPNNLPCINHKDGNKFNNHVDNLEWCTVKENNLHKSTTLRKAKSKVLYIHFKQKIQKYYCLIPLNNKRNFIGYFDTEEEASIAKNNYLSQNDPLVMSPKMN